MNQRTHERQRKNKVLVHAAGMGGILFMAFLTISIRAMAGQLPGISSEEGYASVLYNSENGLPTSEANAVAQTADGFVWIGGYSGLVRYDGKDFYRFDATTGITSVGCLFVDTKGRLWIGTNDKGAALYEDGEFKFFGKEQGLKSGSIKKITQDENGNILLATTCGLAYIDTSLAVHTIDDSKIAEEYMSDLASNSEGVIAGITLDGDIFVLRDLKVEQFYKQDNLQFAKVKSVNFDTENEDRVFFGTEENSIAEIELSKGADACHIIQTNTLVSINRIARMPSGEIWVCADNGMGYLNEEEHLISVNGVAMNNSIDDMMVDYEGNLWFASSRQGVMKIVATRFENISLEAGLPELVVNTTCMYQGNLYIGSDTGLYILDADNQSIQNELSVKLAGIRIRCMTEDTDGNLWVCTYGDNGLLKYDKNRIITSFNTNNGLNSNRVRSIIETSNGDMVVAGSGGINIIRDDRIVESYDSNDGIVNTEILTVCEGEDGILYAGSDGGGIYVIDNGLVTCLNEENGLESGVILRIKKDPKLEGYWIVSGNSIAFLEKGKIRTIHSFPYSNNFDLFFSDQGDMWLLSGNGIYVVNEDDLLSDKTLKYTFYSLADGMPSTATANSRSYLDEKGNLYISGSSNVYTTNINRQEQSDDKVKLAVPCIQIDDQIIYVKDGQKLSIPSDCKRLTIYGYALSYSLQNPAVAYSLNGFDSQEVETTKQALGAVSYTNLKGGNYTFQLKVNNVDGSLNNELNLRILKQRTFWESAWCIVAIVTVLILVLLLAALMTVRIRNGILVRKQQKSKILVQQIIRAFAKTIDSKDKYTNGHSFRVAEYAALLAEKLGYKPEQVEEIHNIALLHDIGKIAIPDAILHKTEQLTEEEYELMKQHTTKGYEILSEISIFPEMSIGAKYHHEKIDGTGYPLGLKGEEIPDFAKIIAVADTLDAMYSTRPYREKQSLEVVADELRRVAGLQLDDKVVTVLLELILDGKIQGD